MTLAGGLVASSRMYFQGEVRIFFFFLFQPSRQIGVCSPASGSTLSEKRQKTKNSVDAPTLAR